MREWTRFKLEGLNLDRALRTLWRENIPVYSAKKYSVRGLELKVGCNRENLFALFGKSCYNITIIQESGVRPVLRSLAGRWGLLAGALVCLLVLVFLSGRIWSVEVEGLERVDGQAFAEALTEAGVSVGSSRDFDAEKVQKTLTTAFDEVSMVTLIRRGTAVRVLVVEREEQPVLRNEAGDLLAAADGVVSGVVVYSGTAVVRPGDRVKAGQVLIEGKLYYPDQSYDPVGAAGEVYGVAEVVYEEVFNGLTFQPYRTGRQVTRTYLSLYGKTFPQEIPAQPEDFLFFERTEQERWLAEGLLLPVRLHRVTYYEIAYAEVFEDFEKVKKVLIEEAEARAAEEAAAKGEIQSSSTEILETGGGKLIRVRTEVRFSLVTPPDAAYKNVQ